MVASPPVGVVVNLLRLLPDTSGAELKAPH